MSKREGGNDGLPQGRLLDHVHLRVQDLEASEDHPGHDSAYALDPDGNNIEAVFHGPSKRSALSVEVEPA